MLSTVVLFVQLAALGNLITLYSVRGHSRPTNLSSSSIANLASSFEIKPDELVSEPELARVARELSIHNSRTSNLTATITATNAIWPNVSSWSDTKQLLGQGAFSEQRGQRYRQDKAKTKLINFFDYTSKVNLGLSNLIKTNANDAIMTTTVQQPAHKSATNSQGLTVSGQQRADNTRPTQKDTAKRPQFALNGDENSKQQASRWRKYTNDTSGANSNQSGHLNGAAAHFMQMIDEMISIQQNVSLRISQANELLRKQQQQMPISKRQGQLPVSAFAVNGANSTGRAPTQLDAVSGSQRATTMLTSNNGNNNSSKNNVASATFAASGPMVSAKTMASQRPAGLLALTSLFSPATKTALVLNKLLPQPSGLLQQQQSSNQPLQQQLAGQSKLQQLPVGGQVPPLKQQANRRMYLWNPLAVTLAASAKRQQTSAIMQTNAGQQTSVMAPHKVATGRFRRSADTNQRPVDCVGMTNNGDQVIVSNDLQLKECRENEDTVAKVIEHNLPSTLNEMERLCNSTQFLLNVCWPPQATTTTTTIASSMSATAGQPMRGQPIGGLPIRDTGQLMRPAPAIMSAKCAGAGKQQAAWPVYKSTLSSTIKERVQWISVNLCIDHEFKQDYVDNVQCLSKWGAKYQSQSACARDYERIIRVVSHEEPHQTPDTSTTTNSNSGNATDASSKTAAQHGKGTQIRPAGHKQSLANELEGDLELRTLCCSFDVFLRCISAQAAKDCGQSASKFVGRFFGKLAGEDVRIHCSQYNYIGSANSSSTTSANHRPTKSQSTINGGQSVSICQDWQKHKQQPARQRSNSTATINGQSNGRRSNSGQSNNQQAAKKPANSGNGNSKLMPLLAPGQTQHNAASTISNSKLDLISLIFVVDSWPLLVLSLSLSTLTVLVQHHSPHYIP